MKIVEEKHNWLIDQQIDELEVLPPHTTTAHLPSEIRTQLKPHASDWIVLQQRHNWRHVKRDEFTRVFIKTKKGFYEWTDKSIDALRYKIAKSLVEIQNWSDSK